MPETPMKTTAGDSATALVLPKNASYNVVAQIKQAKHSLAELATVYLVTEAAGQSQETLVAKRRDLQRFLAFYQLFHRRDRPDEWYVSIIKTFLKHLQGQHVSKALSVDRDQYTGKGFKRVQVKGGDIWDFVPVQRDAQSTRRVAGIARRHWQTPLMTRNSERGVALAEKVKEISVDTIRVDICYRLLRIGRAIGTDNVDAFRQAVRLSYTLWGGRFATRFSSCRTIPAVVSLLFCYPSEWLQSSLTLNSR